MKKILVSISTDSQQSLFDTIVGYDGGADVVLAYKQVDESSITELFYDAIFTRGTKDLHNTAFFLTGRDNQLIEKLTEKIRKLAFDDYQVSVATDPAGAYTTAAAAVVKIKKACHGNLGGKKATVLAGTGPVGQATTSLLLQEGCKLTLTSRKIVRAQKIAKRLGREAKLSAMQVTNDGETAKAIEGADIAIACGPPGICLLPQKVWESSTLSILADVSTVPPLGVEGLKMEDDLNLKNDKILLGAIAIGNLKMKVHKQIIKKLFEDNQQVYDLEKTYELAKQLS